MKANSLFIVCLVVLSGLVLVACETPTEEEIKDEFDQAVEASDDCETDTDCVLVTPGCPLGCGAAVNVEHQEEISQLAKRLIFEWQLGGKGCDYGCAYLEAVCIEGACEAVEGYYWED